MTVHGDQAINKTPSVSLSSLTDYSDVIHVVEWDPQLNTYTTQLQCLHNALLHNTVRAIRTSWLISLFLDPPSLLASEAEWCIQDHSADLTSIK